MIHVNASAVGVSRLIISLRLPYSVICQLITSSLLQMIEIVNMKSVTIKSLKFFYYVGILLMLKLKKKEREEWIFLMRCLLVSLDVRERCYKRTVTY